MQKHRATFKHTTMNIKKLGAVLCFAFSALVATAQQGVEVTGKLKFSKPRTVKLFAVNEGKTTEIATIIPSKTGDFGFHFFPDYEGLYVIGTGTTINGADNYKFYFKGGDKLALTINDSTYVLNGKLNTKENVVLSQWHDLTYTIERKSVNFMKVGNSTFLDFFPEFEEVYAKSKTFLNGKATGNIKFDAQVKDILKLDLATYATTFLNTPRSAHPSVEEYIDYYSTLKAEDFSKNASLTYNYPWGSRLISSIILVNMRQRDIKFLPGLPGLKNQLDMVVSDTLKGDLVLDRAASYKNYDDYITLKNEYGKYVITKSQKQRDMDILTPLATLKPGDAALNFSYADKDGKTVTLASLKGKVVLVDVWATWCGPCIAEIPSLKKLEEEMKGKDVQIISLSTDDPKDKEKWQKMIKDKELGGMQLWAGGPGNDFSKYYKVNTIPRFLVFDKNGKIVSVDSPRPSDPRLKTLLEKELAK